MKPEYDYVQAWKDFQPKSRPLSVSELADAIATMPEIVAQAENRWHSHDARYAYRSRYEEANRADFIQAYSKDIALKYASVLVKLTPLLSLETINVID